MLDTYGKNRKDLFYSAQNLLLDRVLASLNLQFSLNAMPEGDISQIKLRYPLFTQYTIKNSPLDIKSEIRDLGAILDSTFTFHPHLNNML